MESNTTSNQTYHGSSTIDGGKLRGKTDTDYFYLNCPVCKDEILRITDYDILKDEHGNKYNGQLKSVAKRSFTIGFKLACEGCGLVDYFKLSNEGWQKGKFSNLNQRHSQ